MKRCLKYFKHNHIHHDPQATVTGGFDHGGRGEKE